MSNQDSVTAPQELVMGVGESFPYVFDFTALLKSDQTIAAEPAPTVTASISGVVELGTPAANDEVVPADVAAGILEAIAVGKAVIITIEASSVRRLRLTCTVTTNDNYVRKQHGWLTCEA